MLWSLEIDKTKNHIQLINDRRSAAIMTKQGKTILDYPLTFSFKMYFFPIISNYNLPLSCQKRPEMKKIPFLWCSLHLVRKCVLKQFWKLSICNVKKSTSAFYQMATTDSDHLVCVPFQTCERYNEVSVLASSKNQAFVQEAKIRGSKIMFCTEL